MPRALAGAPEGRWARQQVRREPAALNTQVPRFAPFRDQPPRTCPEPHALQTTKPNTRFTEAGNPRGWCRESTPGTSNEQPDSSLTAWCAFPRFTLSNPVTLVVLSSPCHRGKLGLQGARDCVQVFGELGSWSPARVSDYRGPRSLSPTRWRSVVRSTDVHGVPPKLYTLGHMLVSSEASKTHVRKRSKVDKPHSGF